MSFTKEFRSVRDEFPEWEYLNEIGVRDMHGRPINKFTTGLVVDREHNYYLIPQGHTNLSREERKINYYALCIDGKVIKLETEEYRTGRARENNFERHYIVEKIIVPYDWTFNKISVDKIKKIIIEALTVNTYNETFTPERIKEITVKIMASIGGEE